MFCLHYVGCVWEVSPIPCKDKMYEAIVWMSFLPIDVFLTHQGLGDKTILNGPGMRLAGTARAKS